MTDKELLELAAKAAGLMVGSDEGEYRYRDDGTWVAGLYATDNGYPIFWNPLIDDRDAVRLAVRLRLDLMPGDDDQEASTRDDSVVAMENNGNDPCAALRRAITRAAAEIARTTDTGGEA
ncbi:hypothetical protein [Burkholderia glumae]|uniref:hypothetical protein n=1 Tax=Burkholderia glumae TaxID=337 RepID=UPI0020CD7468|nr:hypothetical protein [Burkholderia glumae]MCQ0033625.1 hypothetical protein [Burkholderia glumae]MCQ0037957.1 hypothetical protein [Burkholderia glumae]